MHVKLVLIFPENKNDAEWWKLVFFGHVCV